MGLMLRSGKAYTDRYRHTGSDFYAKIGKTSDVDRNKQEVLFTVEFYLDKDASDRSLYPANNAIFVMKADDFYAWYSEPLLENKGINPYKQLYLYLQGVTDEAGSLVWEDWQSDEGY